MRILVTGAAGFIGLNLLKHMSKAHPEAEILAVDLGDSLRETKHGPGLEGGQCSYRRLDVTDADACRELIRDSKPTYIVHAAAVTLPDEIAASTQLTCSVNLEGTRNVLEAARSAGSVQRVLLVSSSGLYDQSVNAGSCDENHALDLSSSYAHTKRQAEMLMAEIGASGEFSVVSTRLGPVYGEFEWSRTTRPHVSMIQTLLNCLGAGRVANVAGTDMCRDWTQSADIARAMDLLLFAPRLNHQVYNISSGVSVSAGTILDLFVEWGLQVNRLCDTKMADVILNPEHNRKPLVIHRLKQDTGFSPEFDIRRGIAHLIAPQRNA